MKTWFTSDLHFSHKKITEYTDRHLFTSPEEHNDWLVERLNSYISKGDHVYSLGDFCFSHKPEHILEIISRLNGCWHFVKGNHCQREAWNTISGMRKSPEWVNKILFVGDVKVKHFTIEEKKHMFFMSHYAHRVWWNQHYGSLHCFGHSHGSLITKDRSMDVGLDAAYNLFGEHRPLLLEEVFMYLKDREVISGDYHSEER